jgi:hypothetical protein
MKTSGLIGDALDWAVTRANFEVNYETVWRDCREECNFSTEWAHGGPIIEREGIETWYRVGVKWTSRIPGVWEEDGPTQLVSAMRCYVGSRLGNEVEIPEGLTMLGASK